MSLRLTTCLNIKKLFYLKIKKIYAKTMKPQLREYHL